MLDRFLIFLDYDSVEYTNYYKLVLNDEIVNEWPQENINELLEYIKSNSHKFELDIVMSSEATEWKYMEDIKDDINILKSIERDTEKLFLDIRSIFERDFLSNGGVTLKHVFSGVCSTESMKTDEDSDYETKTPDTSKHNDTDITTLARIIFKKNNIK